jgi:hypothetical protein
MARKIISIAAVAAGSSYFGMTVAKAPDTSLDTTPVAYYGANWNRSQVNIDLHLGSFAPGLLGCQSTSSMASSEALSSWRVRATSRGFVSPLSVSRGVVPPLSEPLLSVLGPAAAITSPLSKFVVAHFRTVPRLSLCVDTRWVVVVSLSICVAPMGSPCTSVPDRGMHRTACATASPSGTQRANTFADASRSSSTTCDSTRHQNRPSSCA